MSKKDYALKLALEGAANYIDALGRDSRKYRQTLAEQQEQQDSTCNNTLRDQGKSYPRTCKKCGLGPCIADRVQPAQQEPVALREVALTRDTNGVCIVTVNGREAIRDNGDVISHFATLDWFASGMPSKKPERDIDSMEVHLYNRGWNDAIEAAHGIKEDA